MGRGESGESRASICHARLWDAALIVMNAAQKSNGEYFFFSCCQKEKMLRFKWRQQQQKAPRDEPTVNDGSSSVNQKLAVTNFFFADMWQQKKEIIQRVLALITFKLIWCAACQLTL